jgi:hypothetical protein
MTDTPTPTAPRRRRAWLAAGAVALGASGALYLGAGAVGGSPAALRPVSAGDDISGPCDEAEHADDPRCTGVSAIDTDDGGPSTSTPSTSTTTSPSTAPGGGSPGSGEVRTIQAADAGTVFVAVEGTQLRLVLARPNEGWRVEVEQGAGREIEVDFESGTREVDVDVELEDGRLRERVRIEDDADDSETRIEDGQVVRQESGDDADDRDDDVDDDDDDDVDDDGTSGRGDDDGDDDDRSGPSGDDD